MVYAYIRVSTDKQGFDGQKYSLEKYAEYKGLKVDEWIEEKVSGKVPREKRDLGKLVARMVTGDVLITPELSRLGRTITDTLVTLDLLEQKGCIVHLIKENQVSGTTEFTMLCAVYAIIAQTERQRISERTKEALAYRKSQGMIIGHYKGYKCQNIIQNNKLTPYKQEIVELLHEGKSIYYIARKYNVTWITARNFIRDRLEYDIFKIQSVSDYHNNINIKSRNATSNPEIL